MKTTHSRFGGFNFISSWFKNIGLSKVSVVWLGALIFTMTWIIAELCKLNPDDKHCIAFLPISAEWISIFVSGIGFFISFLGVLSIIEDNIDDVKKEVKEDFDSLRDAITNPSSKNPFIFIAASKEDLKFVKAIRQCLIPLVGDKLKDCLKDIKNDESTKVVDTVRNCMDKIHIERDVITVQTGISTGLENCTIAIILYCKNNEFPWIELRVNSLCSRGKTVILLTDNEKLGLENKVAKVFNPFKDGKLDKSQCTRLVEMMKQYL